MQSTYVDDGKVQRFEVKSLDTSNGVAMLSTCTYPQGISVTSLKETKVVPKNFLLPSIPTTLITCHYNRTYWKCGARSILLLVIPNSIKENCAWRLVCVSLLHKKFNRYIMVGWCSVHTSVYGCETIQRKSAGKMKGADEEELPFLRHSAKGRFIYDQPYELSYETPCVRFSFTEKAKVLSLVWFLPLQCMT